MPVGWGEVKGWIFTMFEESGANGDSSWCDEGPAKFDVSGSFSVCIAGHLLVRLNMPSKRETVANSVVRKSNTSTSFNFTNDIRDFRFGLSAKLDACLLEGIFNVTADRNFFRRHAPYKPGQACAMEDVYNRAKCNATRRADSWVADFEIIYASSSRCHTIHSSIYISPPTSLDALKFYIRI